MDGAAFVQGSLLATGRGNTAVFRHLRSYVNRGQLGQPGLALFVFWVLAGAVRLAYAIQFPDTGDEHYSTFEIAANEVIDNQLAVPLSPLTIIRGCGNDTCSLDVAWEQRKLVVPQGGRLELENLSLVNTGLQDPLQSVVDRKGALPVNFLLPSVLSIQPEEQRTMPSLTMTNVTIATSCSIVVSYVEALHSSLLGYQQSQDAATQDVSKQQQQLDWVFTFQVLPGWLHINKWNSSLVSANNITISCASVGPASTNFETSTSTLPMHQTWPLAVSPAFYEQDLRMWLEQLPLQAANIIISIQVSWWVYKNIALHSLLA